MQHTLPSTPAEPLHIPDIHHAALRDPVRWLRLGWRDLRQVSGLSLAIGAALVLFGYLLTWGAWSSPILVLTFVSGFLLAGPFLGLVFYDLSRRLERHEPPTLGHALASLRENLLSITLLVVVLGVILLAWIRFTALLTALSVAAVDPSLPVLLDKLLMTPEGLAMLGVFLLSGGLLAALVFTLSAVSFPMLLDRPVDTLTAVATSVRAVWQNLPAMLVWAALIAGLTLVGMLTAYLGLIVVIPLVGHATWYAYRQVVAPEQSA